MVSQRYVEFRKFLRRFWRHIGRYMLLLYCVGVGIFWLIEIFRPFIGTFAFIWIFACIIITYLLFYWLGSDRPQDLDGDA
jgi:hypothetical protein